MTGLPSVRTVQVFFTAAELAEMAARLGYKALPHTKSGVIRRAKRDGWNDLPGSLCRKRAGKTGGGGLEYHISLVPALQSKLVLERKIKADSATRRDHAIDAQTAAKSSGAAPSSRGCSTRDARAQIMASITGYASRKGLKISGGITAFLRAQDDHDLWRAACEARDRGDFLTPQHMRALQDGSRLTGETGFWIPEDVLALANNRPRQTAAFQKVGRSTLYGWLKAYQEGGAEALAPEATKAEQPIPDEFWTFMRVYARPAKPKITHAYAAYQIANPGRPQLLTLDQVCYTLRHKLNHIERNAGREGTLTLRARMAYVSRDTEGLFPTSVYTGDGKTFDAEIADPVSRGPMRPELTSILDVATKFCVGWSVARKENVVAVTEALRRACIDRGVPAMFYVDRGAGYKNKRFDNDGTGLMARLAITKMHALPYGSQAKGLIERSHQTIWDPLARTMPTYLGADMDKEARQKAFKQSRSELKEFGWSKLLMPWDEFLAKCQDTVDTYNATPHSSLPKFVDPASGRIRHMSPAEAWAAQEASGFEVVTVDPQMIDDLFRPYEERTVSRCLVRLWNNEYFSMELNPWHEQKVLVGYDDAQADRVWVREIDRQTGEPGRLICVAEFGGNRVDYVPRTALKAAEDRRFKGQMKRLDEKRFAKEAQRVTPWIEQEPVEVADFIDVVPARAPEPVAVADNHVSPDPVTTPRRRLFGSDEELAAHALQNPTELNPNQVRLLRDCIKDSTARKVLEMAGIDTEALRTLLRAYA